MQVRHAIAAVTVAAFALTLSACTGEPIPNLSDAPATSSTMAATPGPTTTPKSAATPAGEIREVSPGFHLDNVTEAMHSGLPSYADKSADEIAVILNAACDAMDLKNNPQAAADAIQTYGIDAYDAAFSVSAAIQLYCPEYQSFLAGK